MFIEVGLADQTGSCLTPMGKPGGILWRHGLDGGARGIGMGTARGGQALDIHQILDRHRDRMERRRGWTGSQLEQVGEEVDRIEMEMGVGVAEEIDLLINMGGDVDRGDAPGAQGLGEFPNGSVLEAGVHGSIGSKGLA